jgi:hypothetical protein
VRAPFLAVFRAALVVPSAIAAVALTAMTGCGEPRVALGGGTREYVAADYEQVFRRWTREDQVLSLAELENLLTVAATFESYDFRWAYVIRYSEDYRLTIEERRALMQKTLDEAKDVHQFYVALYGANWRWTDLSRPNSAWTVRLIDSRGDETAPVKIELIPKPAALERAYFPYTSVWRQAFRIAFPTATVGRPTIADDAEWFGLRFAGVEGGNGELRWSLDASTGKRTAAHLTSVTGDPRFVAEMQSATGGSHPGEQLE